jgi:predicted dehydrogenase
MAQPVRIGVVGTSWWSDLMFLPCLRDNPRAELAAICGRNSETAGAIAAKYNIPQLYASYSEMFARAGLDAVVIAAPDDQHYAMTMAALEAGLHVLCEKPLALNVAHARAMYENAEARQLIHMVMLSYRWMPQFRHMKVLLDQGYVGRPYQADFRFLMDYGSDGAYLWRFDGQRANGVLGDLGTHIFDIARWYLGDIAGVSARLAAMVQRPGAGGGPPVPANDCAVLLLDFASGASATVQLSAVTLTHAGDMQIQATVYGERGTLEATFQPATALRGAPRGAEPELLPVPDELWGEADRGEPFEVFYKLPVGVHAFVEAVAEGRRPVSPSFADGLYAQAVVDSALAAHASGRRVDVAATLTGD